MADNLPSSTDLETERADQCKRSELFGGIYETMDEIDSESKETYSPCSQYLSKSMMAQCMEHRATTETLRAPQNVALF